MVRAGTTGQVFMNSHESCSAGCSGVSAGVTDGVLVDSVLVNPCMFTRNHFSCWSMSVFDVHNHFVCRVVDHKCFRVWTGVPY